MSNLLVTCLLSYSERLLHQTKIRKKNWVHQMGALDISLWHLWLKLQGGNLKLNPKLILHSNKLSKCSKKKMKKNLKNKTQTFGDGKNILTKNVINFSSVWCLRWKKYLKNTWLYMALSRVKSHRWIWKYSTYSSKTWRLSLKSLWKRMGSKLIFPCQYRPTNYLMIVILKWGINWNSKRLLHV